MYFYQTEEILRGNVAVRGVSTSQLDSPAFITVNRNLIFGSVCSLSTLFTRQLYILHEIPHSLLHNVTDYILKFVWRPNLEVTKGALHFVVLSMCKNLHHVGVEQDQKCCSLRPHCRRRRAEQTDDV